MLILYRVCDSRLRYLKSEQCSRVRSTHNIHNTECCLCRCNETSIALIAAICAYLMLWQCISQAVQVSRMPDRDTSNAQNT